VVLVVAAVPAADFRVVVRDEFDALDPLDLLEAELDLVRSRSGAPWPKGSGSSFMS
jgi:hypothetical protein